jgi:hypothetical protein
VRDASCRTLLSPTEHCRDVPPPIETPQADLAAGHEAEEEHQRRVLGGQAALRLDSAPELFVQSLNHVRCSERLPLALGKLETREQFFAPLLEASDHARGAVRHFRSKAVKAPRAVARFSA